MITNTKDHIIPNEEETPINTNIVLTFTDV